MANVVGIKGKSPHIYPTSSNAAGGGGPTQPTPGEYGDGSDGAVVLDGVTSYPFATLSGGNYKLTRDVYATTFVVSPGVHLNTFSFRVLAQTSIVNGGVIENDGLPGILEAAGNGGGDQVNGGTVGLGSDGGIGGNNGVGSNGGNAFNAIPNTVGTGGGGGAGGGNAGGTTGTFDMLPILAGSIRSFPGGLIGAGFGFEQDSGSVFTVAGGGGGGGGGGGVDSGSTGGGGGGGGGNLVIASPLITNTGTISSKGGNGGNGSGSAAAGGGGGGQGGTIWVITRQLTGNPISVSGGVGGTGVHGGIAGTNGSDGMIVSLAA